MKQNMITIGIAGALIGGMLVWLVMSNQPVERVTRDYMMQSETIDAHFIEQMIPHHEDAITMAEIALTRAEHPELKELAQNIIDSQSAENDQMRSWYRDWFDRELPEGSDVMQYHGMGSGGRMHMGMRGEDRDIDALESAEDFDRAFIEHMIPHHQMAVMMASMLRSGSDRPEMMELADNIITAQTEEIEMMREWLREW